MKKLLIIGGVAAGATAAGRARRLDGEVEIILLEAGPDISFANCGLPYYLGGEVKNRSDLILASPETFDEQYRVKAHTMTEAVAIDRDKKRVEAIDHNTQERLQFEYDRLILAQGGRPIVPPLPGVEQENVFQLWTLGDMDRIDQFIREKNPQTAVVVGAGFIGLEMVEALVRRGLEVTLVEKAPQVMPNLEAEISAVLMKEMLDYGVDLQLGISLKEIGGNRVILEDGTLLKGDLILLSVGVKPTLRLALDAGLSIGPAGGLLVDERLQTSDPNIFAAGDMVEIENAITKKSARVPLAGPANRQGRIAAENALGGNKKYRGTFLTSTVKFFDVAVGSTGLGLSQARQVGFAADAVVVHKMSHTSYYPGASRVTLQLVYDRESGRILGAQSAGKVGIDKSIDVVATAIAAEMTLDELAQLDFAYAPPFNSPNGPVHIACFAGENKRSGFSPSILARDLEEMLLGKEALVLDLRDPISFAKAHLEGSQNVSISMIRENLDRISKEHMILLISDDGQKGHVALRLLKNEGFQKAFNLSGGYLSLERQARAAPFEELRVTLFPITPKSAKKEEKSCESEQPIGEECSHTKKAGALIIDVRTSMEFEMGAIPDAINIPLDLLPQKAEEVIGDRNREVVVYCASGARSAYAVRLLTQLGYTDVTNGGGLHEMMARISSNSAL